MTINQLLTQPFQFVKHRQFQTVHCNLHNEERKEIVKSLFGVCISQKCSFPFSLLVYSYFNYIS